MNDRTYRSVGDAARLGAPERDARTGRRTADRSDKDRRHRRPRPRRALLIGIGLLVALLLAGTAVALTSGGNDDDEAATRPSSTRIAGAPTTGGAGASSSGSGGSGGSGAITQERYELTVETVSGFSYAEGSGDLGPNEGVGNVMTVAIMVTCRGSACTVDTFGGLLPSTSGQIDDGSFTAEGREPFNADPTCAPQERTWQLELTFADDGGVTGTYETDTDPGRVPCEQGNQSGARYTYRIEGEKA